MELVKMDRFGRIMIPIRIRRQVSSDEFQVRFENKSITLEPVPTWEQLAGSLPKINMKEFWREHRRANKE